MIVKDMTQDDLHAFLRRSHLGSLACAKDGQPYVSPFHFIHHGNALYGFATLGRRIEWMRVNPLVCVEVGKVASREAWQTAILFGRYEELPDRPETYEAHHLAQSLLAEVPLWWEPGCVETPTRPTLDSLNPIYFRIAIGEMSGRIGLATTEGAHADNRAKQA